MAESGVREIQLSGKQLVFLFMASVVLVVVVFLLGVSVGRGARTPIGPVNEASVGGTPEGPPPPPPATQAGSNKLDYDKGLKGADGGAKPADSTPAQDPPPTATATKTATPAPPPSPPPSAQPAKPPAATAAPAPPPKSTPTPASAPATKTTAPAGSWFVQVDSFRSKDLADALVAKLKSKGFETVILDEPKPLLRVRVGPYGQQSAAAAAASQLKKDGFSSSLFVTR